MTVEAFKAGERVKIRGTSKGKGFQGTIKRHNFTSGPKTHGSHNVRAPGSIGASATPSRVLKGIRGPGQMGNKRVTQKGLEVVAVDAAENLLLVRGSVPGPPGAWWRSAPMADAPMLGAHRRQGPAPREAFGARFTRALVHQSVRAEQAARRRGTASTKTRAKVSGGGAKPWRQKGTGRARAGSSRSPIWTGGGTAFGPQPRSYTFKVNRKEQRGALRSALSLHAERGSLAILDAGAFAAPKTARRPSCWRTGATAPASPTLVVLDAGGGDAALSFRNLARVAVLTPEDVGVGDLLARPRYAARLPRAARSRRSG